MDASGAGRLNRSSPSCLNRSAQRIDFFYGLLSDELPGAPAFAERERLQCGRPRHRRELDRFLAFTHGVVVPDLRRGGGGDAATAVEVLAGPPSGAARRVRHDMRGLARRGPNSYTGALRRLDAWLDRRPQDGTLAA